MTYILPFHQPSIYLLLLQSINQSTHFPVLSFPPLPPIRIEIKTKTKTKSKIKIKITHKVGKTPRPHTTPHRTTQAVSPKPQNQHSRSRNSKHHPIPLPSHPIPYYTIPFHTIPYHSVTTSLHPIPDPPKAVNKAKHGRTRIPKRSSYACMRVCMYAGWLDPSFLRFFPDRRMAWNETGWDGMG
ncbi:hypothetical protein P153DRAFT_167726 [Dothidotthia symphoricarpi CBS 119687]|uniref:Uncharacterized protein n=1 Tax=Dothidotthia symphoricarpi CBS 119687 TaxID=1392245 RepID=A0A6A6AKU6_9PLEO|nr:uncharacterized protein P153DRAFT_167726 [Dothidotthia symphoricarpi CBS 119687]KAF2132579.1 hypothetical protein P153DRAFT_167726 [Dothidotthia symphoricarpi CBS 119687]